MKPHYNPRNRNECSGRDRKATSRAFDDIMSNRRDRTEPCGFAIKDKSE